MNCANITDELTAFVQEELPLERLAEVQAHLEECAACRAEVRKIKELLTAAQKLPEIEAAPGFFARLKQRLALKTLPAERADVLTGRSKVRPTALRPQRHTSRFKWRYLAAAAAVILTALAVTPFLKITSGTPVAENDKTKLELWKQRNAAPRWEKVLKGDRPGLKAPGFQKVEELYLAPYSKEGGEICVYAYSTDDVEKLRAAAHTPRERKKFNDFLASAKKVRLEDGTLRLPTRLSRYCFRSFAAAGRRVAVLRLSGRWEIWDAPTLHNYLRREPRLIPVPAPPGTAL